MEEKKGKGREQHPQIARRECKKTRTKKKDQQGIKHKAGEKNQEIAKRATESQSGKLCAFEKNTKRTNRNGCDQKKRRKGKIKRRNARAFRKARGGQKKQNKYSSV